MDPGPLETFKDFGTDIYGSVKKALFSHFIISPKEDFKSLRYLFTID